MRINYNVSAMLSNNALQNNDNLLSQSLERLSSGLKINHAKDNPAGLAMAKRMNAQIEGLSKATQNASDGVSVIETADGAMTEISEMLQRINELSVKAANGTLSDNDRKTVQDEVDQLKAEITRIANTTEFNGQKLLNGEFENKGYTNNINIKVNGYSGKVISKVYEIDQIEIKNELDENGSYIVDLENLQLDENFPNGTKASVKDNILSLHADNGFEIRLDLAGIDFKGKDSLKLPDASQTPALEKLKIDVTGIGEMRLQIGANEGQIVGVDIPAITLQNLGIDKLDVSTQEGATEAIDRVSDGIKYISNIRGRLGAYQNRLESTINSLDITSENMTAAYSRIMDVDMAEEMTHYSTANVLTQAGTSMLAQANQRPSQVLQLLQ